MDAATTAASQTSTVAPIQAPVPSIESPSVTRTVTISEASVAISATPPRSGPGARRNCIARNGWRSAKTIVKTTTATTKPVTSRLT
ncbi:MAG: hypothetical protein ACRELC_10780, partial [Gemmatimonadota bacterium]